ncbi:GatB/YqeY domain-containing protein [Lysinibacillus sp. MHQ-1]|nr:GatB/YqeY domain-containing protein [Lysinibacillus sp. MHQ-1]
MLKKAERADLIEKEEAKLVLLKSFLPKQLSEEEIAEKISSRWC